MVNPKENVMRQSMQKILEKVGEDGGYDVEKGVVYITGVTENELEECLRLMEEPGIEVSVEEEENDGHKVTAKYKDM